MFSSSVRSEGSFYFDDDSRVHGNGRGRAPKNPEVEFQYSYLGIDPILVCLSRKGRQKQSLGTRPGRLPSLPTPPTNFTFSVPLYSGTRLFRTKFPVLRFFIYLYIYIMMKSLRRKFFTHLFLLLGGCLVVGGAMPDVLRISYPYIVHIIAPGGVMVMYVCYM